jgi:uncharacterized iron-regulated protein
VKVAPGQVVATRNGKTVSLDDIAKAAANTRYVYVGESHDNPHHHQMQAEVIAALVRAGRNVVVGMEMFTRPNQVNLAPWTMGMWTEEQFIEGADWKKQWGFDFGIYRPIFTVVRDNKLPLIALNLPRDWVRAVGRGGYSALTPEQKAELPEDLYLGNKDHRAIFNSLMGGHPPSGTQGENIYSAQVLWDEGMADTAIKYMAGRPSANTVMVVVAGSGHVMYGQGINWRVARRTGDKGVTVMAGEAAEPREVARGVGDFFYLSPEVERKQGG